MATIRLPGLVDVHVHMREPGATHKEDWDSGTAAALAGGFTTVLAMPNTAPPVTDLATLELVEDAARAKARCDYGHFVGAGPDNATAAATVAHRTVGLKMYLDQTYGPLRLDDLSLWMEHLERWPRDRPIVAHAEGRSVPAIILLAHLAERPVHICHVARRDEILAIRRAKDHGIAVTCEVAPHHLLLSTADVPCLGEGRAEVRPRLESSVDRDALWEHLEAIDCFATDHAPHLLAEKDGPKPPPGYPGLETAVPLLLTAVHEGRLSLEDLVRRLHDAPRRLFGLAEQPDTWVEVDTDAVWTIPERPRYSRAGWTPFAGRAVRGRVQRVVLRGHEAMRDGEVRAAPGTGRNVRA